jgi:hypothetical protein
MAPLYRRPSIALLIIGLSGCKLIDQTTFAPSPSKNPVLASPAPSAAPVVDTRVPLITINQGTPVSSYRNVLRSVVSAARARDPNVQFDITMVVPAAGASLTAVTATRPEAAALMQEMAADGIPDSNIHLRAATDAHLTQRQIRVYVR